MKSLFLSVSAVLGFLGVAFGAFGAHVIENQISEKMMDTYNTGVLYHLIHSAVLISISLNGEKLFRSGIFFISGILLFSFSLYVYSLTGISFFAMITPFGGVSFLVGWGLLVYYGIKNHKK